LIRKLMKAARTERDLEEQRLQGPFADELRAGKARAAASQHPSLVAVPEPAPASASPLASADTHTANPAHLPLVAAMAREDAAEVLWVRSTTDHVVWCERRPSSSGPTRQLLRVAKIEAGSITTHWSFS
jgi:hypothetical protein